MNQETSKWADTRPVVQETLGKMIRLYAKKVIDDQTDPVNLVKFRAISETILWGLPTYKAKWGDLSEDDQGEYYTAVAPVTAPPMRGKAAQALFCLVQYIHDEYLNPLNPEN